MISTDMKRIQVDHFLNLELLQEQVSAQRYYLTMFRKPPGGGQVIGEYTSKADAMAAFQMAVDCADKIICAIRDTVFVAIKSKVDPGTYRSPIETPS